jgi:hypothetical protein
VPEELNPSDNPTKEVREALEAIFAAAPGEWRLVKAGHWGSLRCTRGCCMIPVDGTPKNPGNHARRLEREARKHPRDQNDPQNRLRNES